MDLKKLYRDVSVLLGKEIPIYTFLTYFDMGARALLCRYGKKLLIGKGEYTTPETLDSSAVLDVAFYTSLIYYVAGMACGDEAMIKKSDSEANGAYILLWRQSAKNKTRKCDRW